MEHKLKFLVTGSAGLVGRQVVNDLLKLGHDTIATYHNLKPENGVLTHLDLLDFNSIKKTIKDHKPNIIFHLAAMTDVEQCEREPKLANLINAESTKIIAKEASNIDCFLVYLSTDYVFDGHQGLKKEEDTTNPLGSYGKSKLTGEDFIKKIQTPWCIARTSTPFGMHSKKKTFPSFVIEQLQHQRTFNAIKDQFTSPTYVPNLSQMLIEISLKRITGIIHTAGATRISRYDTALYLGKKLNLDTSLIKSISISEMNWHAPRPRDSALNISKASSILNEKPLDVFQGLNSFINELGLKI